MMIPPAATDRMAPPGVIVNADDYGLTRGVSEAILLAFREGVVTTTTAMTNLPGIREDLERLAAEAPGLGVGVHLNLTTGVPILPPALVPTLVRADGSFRTADDLRRNPETFDHGEVEAEWRAQVDRFLALGTTTLDHLDSHHNASYAHPSFTEAMLELARELGAPVRSAPPLGDCHPESRRLVEDSRNSIPQPDHLVTEMMDAPGPGTLVDIVTRVLPGTVAEIMVHPGRCDTDLLACSTYTLARELELGALVDPAVRALAADGRRFGTFRSLATTRT